MTSDVFIFNYPPVLARVLTQNGRLKIKDAIFVCLNFYATVRCKKALSERQLQGMPRSAARRFFETYRCVGKRCKTFRSTPLMQRTPGLIGGCRTTRPKDNSDQTTRPNKISDQDNSAQLIKQLGPIHKTTQPRFR